MGFLIRLFLALGIAAAIYFLVNGGGLSNFFQQAEENGLIPEFEFGDSRPVLSPGNLVPSGAARDAETNEASVSTSSPEQYPDLVELFKKIKKEEANENIERNVPAEDALSLQFDKLPEFTSVCFPTVKRVCTLDDCSRFDAGARFVLLNADTKLLARCEPGTCESFDADFERSGEYETYEPTSVFGLALVKEVESQKNPNSTAFIEVSFEGIKTVIYSGHCLSR